MKCSMQGPVCSHCKRRGERCEYLDRVNDMSLSSSDDLYGTHSNTRMGKRARNSLCSNNPRPKYTTNTDPVVTSNSLLSHYMHTTSGTLNLVGEDDSELNPWRMELSPLIHAIPFLYHIVLSLSALHIYHLDSHSTKVWAGRPSAHSQAFINSAKATQNFIKPRAPHSTISATYTLGSNQPSCTPFSKKLPSHLEEAYANQIAGSTAFRNSVPVVDSENWLPILAFAIATLVFRLETCRRAMTFSSLVTDVLAALRTAAIAGEEIKPFFLNSALASCLMNRARHTSVPMHPSMSLSIARLKTHNYEREAMGAIQVEEKILCAQAIDSLQRWAVFVSGNPRTWLHYIWWPADVSSQFIEMISDKRPWPLLIFVYWCAIMDQGVKRWFLHDWASKAAVVAMAEIGPGSEWEEILEWPRVILGRCAL
ncbi:hypothetical protein BGZ63DRAFT_138198 [Mariannaea sp. PMI_226]|nr:hypothetical protein BGZ63DRAFT_138198 [Mariannaea sp. PMI_226]